jgi:lipopolysaccharide cholinephosphotransferase
MAHVSGVQSRKRIRLDSETLRDLQLVQLELLVEFDRICRAHDIPYCIIAGTMLGATRHGGFIPRDDDADVAMLRADYERFRAVCAYELDPAKYYFQDHKVTPGYRWGYGKLRRADTLFLREHQEHMPYSQGVFIDVFPLDAVPESLGGRAVKNFECFCLRKILWSSTGSRASKSPLARGWFRLLSAIPEQVAYRWLDSLVERARKVESRWVRILMFPTPNREYGYLRKWYENPVPVTFEGMPFFGVSDAAEYLTFKFGNWRELPPANQR